MLWLAGSTEMKQTATIETEARTTAPVVAYQVVDKPRMAALFACSSCGGNRGFA
jgi:hypothetical protein